jgi:hypothetical protein
MDIGNLGLGELKILAYNTSRTLNMYSRDLQVIENLIAQREKEQKTSEINKEPVVEENKETVVNNTVENK